MITHSTIDFIKALFANTEPEPVYFCSFTNERGEGGERHVATAGDLPVCEVARVLRLPGSHNTKDGAFTEVEIIELHPERRYDFEELEEWLSEQSPVMLRKAREFAQTAGESGDDDPFLQYA